MSDDKDLVPRLRRLADSVVAAYGTSNETILDGGDPNDVDYLYWAAHSAADLIEQLHTEIVELKTASIARPCPHPLEKRLRDVYSNSVSSSAREICKQCGTVIFETKEDT